MTKDNEISLYCQIMQNCMGVKKPLYAGQKPKYKHYKAGEKVIGKEYNASSIPTQHTSAIITKDRYIITLNNVMILGEQQEAKVITDEEMISDRLKKKIKSFSNSNGAQGIISYQNKKSKFMVNGAITGGVFLFLYAMLKGGNKGNSFVLGAVLGGLAGRFIADYSNRQN